MIVKNESKIISRLLTCVLPLIDTYCICDTGSTDDTVSIITTFFENKGIAGKIVTEPFRDFGYNRTFALKQCSDLPDVDYILLIDADMILQIGEDIYLNIDEFKASLTADAYYIFQGSQTFFYKNVRIIKNNPLNSYWGVTHEYIKTQPNAVYEEINKSSLFISDVGDGGSKSDKFERDIRLLKKGLEDLPNNDRYTFYLANSYRESNQFDLAIETYKNRIKLGGWNQEVWYSYYAIGLCYKQTNDMANAIHYWLDAYAYMPERIENLYEIITHYRHNNKYALAYMYYAVADYERNLTNSTDHLFMHKDVWDYKIDYEFSIIGYYCNRNNLDVRKSSMTVLSNPHPSESIQKNVLSNYKFYVEKLKDFETPNPNLTALSYISSTFDMDSNVFEQSTPSICFQSNSGTLIVNTRFVNYKIDDKGDYINKSNIITRNIITTFNTNREKWSKIDEFELKHNTDYDAMYVGLEDIRLYSKNNNLYYNANRGLINGTMAIEHGTINLKSHRTLSSIVKKEDQRQIEKNWVMFSNNDKMQMIYEWYPLTIGVHRDHPNKLIDDRNNPLTQLHITDTFETPAFFKWVRGSTNGVAMENNEIWFICHIVSYEDRRHYYHLFVVLNSNTFELKRYSRLFTFDGAKVEYTLGFVYIKSSDSLLIGYSTMDRTTKYLEINVNNVEKLF
jgi:tetratricopeptide (TPR) repeat protein